MKKLQTSFWMLSLSLVLLNCKENKTIDSEKPVVDSEQTVNTNAKKPADVTYCYQNVYGSEPYVDIEELSLQVNQDTDSVSGEYNWLPAEKDKRIGTFKGIKNNDVIDAKYTYEQEGISNTFDLKIYLKSDSVQIESINEPSLNNKIKAIDCDDVVKPAYLKD